MSTGVELGRWLVVKGQLLSWEVRAWLTPHLPHGPLARRESLVDDRGFLFPNIKIIHTLRFLEMHFQQRRTTQVVGAALVMPRHSGTGAQLR